MSWSLGESSWGHKGKSDIFLIFSVFFEAVNEHVLVSWKLQNQ